MRRLVLPTDKRVLVVSDTHILLPGALRGKLEAFILAQEPEILVFAGDTLDFFYAQVAKNKASVQVGEGVAFLTFLKTWLEANPTRRLVVLEGNHDPNWDFFAIARKLPQLAPLVGPGAALAPFLQTGRMVWGLEAMLGDTLITHSHLGFWGEWMWRVSEPLRRTFGKTEPHLLTPAFLRLRHRIVRASGFYVRLGVRGRLAGARRVIHGHVHTPIALRRWGVDLVGLPCWREDEAHAKGGGMLYDPARQTWECLKAAS